MLLLGLILVQKHLLSRLGARSVYALWAAVPALIIALLLSPVLSSQHASAVFQRYQVGIQQLSGATASNNTLLYCWLVGFIGFLAFLLLSYISNRALLQKAQPVSGNEPSVVKRLADSSAGP